MNKEQILAELMAEKAKLLNLGHMNSELLNRVEEIVSQIEEIEGGDTFRSHELIENINFIDEVDEFGEVENESFDDNNYGYISESFHDPSLDY